MRSLSALLIGVALTATLGCDGTSAGRMSGTAISPAAGGTLAATGKTPLWPFNVAEAKRRQEEAARVLGVKPEMAIELGDGVKLELVLVPNGQFTMGGRTDRDVWCIPAARSMRIVRPFWMGKYKVTQEVWQRVMAKNPSEFKGPKNPVENVSWDDCQEFLKKLNDLLLAGKGANRRDRFRLPSDAEWEWACRAGSAAAYYFGDDEDLLKDYAWVYKNSELRPHPVGQKKPNAWGLFDMHGNLWEWCEDDWHLDLNGIPADGSAWVDKPRGEVRVIRGSSWLSGPLESRSAYRGVASRGGDDRLGFRLVLAPALR